MDSDCFHLIRHLAMRDAGNDKAHPDDRDVGFLGTAAADNLPAQAPQTPFDLINCRGDTAMLSASTQGSPVPGNYPCGAIYLTLTRSHPSCGQTPWPPTRAPLQKMIDRSRTRRPSPQGATETR